ncbi:SDR family NAD(P)-dependent oxidoreductase [Mesonia aestuariivivens]|uniref:SDR family oxidoreductase n=1 Tax=Mesonia aestuariivivens TaxID=2796128 RepID=A0ABS6VYQ9_9FLAO|nr:SDR family NAD(P)-dependent oxidoreductase [Mesonia aestuariivivens]MBW2960401.1 SDR family oxidoreductase [Mesonia aestuariivivens]
MSKFKDKTVIITGGSGSIGFVTAKELAQQGAKVLLVDIDEKALKEKEAEAKRENLEISYVVADVSKPEQVKNYVDTCIERYGKIDFFFNNAGIEGKVAPMSEYPDDVFDKVMEVNVKGTYLGMKYVSPKMEDGGSIVITSSVAGLQGSPKMVPYVTSKHAVIGIMRTAALELAERKIRVNTVNPGSVDNRMMRSLEDGVNPGHGNEVKEAYTATIPLGRYATPEDISHMVCYLFSDDNTYATGQTFVVDGGMKA